MDCHDRATVDLCAEPECLNSAVTFEDRPDLGSGHSPNHNMLKVHRIVFNRDTARTERNAKDALGAAREKLSDLKAKKKPMPQCVHCQNVVSLPCWYCVDCTSEFTQNNHFTPLTNKLPYLEGRFICADCEYKCLAFNETHTKKHTLVRVIQKVEESKVSMEESFKAVKGQLESLEGELLKVKQLLSKLFEKGAEGSPSDPLTKGDILDAATAEPSLGGPLLAKGEGDGGDRGREGSGSDGEDGE